MTKHWGKNDVTRNTETREKNKNAKHENDIKNMKKLKKTHETA